jgi:hypothetical protein
VWYLLGQRLLQRRLLLFLAKGIYGLLQLYLPSSFLLDLLLHDLCSLHHYPSSGHVLLHESEALIFLAKACQLIIYDSFDFLLKILALVISSFGF